MSDARTTRLAHLQLTPERVEALVRYQRAMVRHLAERGNEAWAGRMAFAHAAALKDSGLDGQDARKLTATAAAYCGRRWQSCRLTERLAEAGRRVGAARSEGQPAPAKEARLLEQLPGEVKRLEDFSAFVEQHGDGALPALRAREAELLALHQELAHLEGQGQLHPRR